MREVTEELGRFTKLNRKWYVSVATKYEAGDIVNVASFGGDVTTTVQLLEEKPYSDQKKRNERRWTFEEVDAQGVSLASKRDDLLEDGFPEWWSRKANGSVLWPREADAWQERGSTKVGTVKHHFKQRNKVGWYYGDNPGEWMKLWDFMDRFVFIERPGKDIELFDKENID